MGLESNSTSLVFDKDVLIPLINDVIKEYGIYFELNQCNFNQWPMLFKHQQSIRDKFDDYYEKGILKRISDDRKLGLPDYFALFMLLLFHNSIETTNSWDELIVKLNKDNVELSWDKSTLDDTIHCACSHKITEIHTLSNKESNIFILVGCVCVEKQLIKGVNGQLSTSVKHCKKQRLQHKKYLKEMKVKTEITNKQQQYIKKYNWNIDVIRDKMREDGIPIPCFVPLYL